VLTGAGRVPLRWRGAPTSSPRRPPARVPGDPEDHELTLLGAANLTVMCFGLAISLAVWARGGAAAGGLAALFALGAAREAAVLLSGTAWPLPADPILLGEGALLGSGIAGLVALASLRRTTRERDRAEDLHWGSMEAVRVVSELAARPGAGIAEKIPRVLELGAARFELDHAIACRLGEGPPEILASLAPAGGLEGAALASALAPRLRLVAAAPRPVAWQGDTADTPASLADFLGAPVRIAGEPPFVLGFAGARSPRAPFTATDKDLLGLMAQWLRSELELRARAEPPPRRPEESAAAPPLRDRNDLNAAVRRVESRLRSLVAADATLEVSLAEALPALRPPQLPLAALVESLVVAAHALAPDGALRIETGLPAGRGAASDDAFATLSVRVRSSRVDAEGLARAFAAGAVSAESAPMAGSALPLGRLEALLRRGGGDLSAQVETGRGALLTAFLPTRRVAASALRAAAPERRAADAAPLH
jgi:hypothetical protein